MRKHYTETHRAELVALVARGEVSPRVAATRLGIPESTAYYWLKQSRRPPVAVVVAKTPPRPGPTAAPGFSRLMPATAAAPAITIRVGEAAIAVAHDFDAELLRAVVAALREPQDHRGQSHGAHGGRSAWSGSAGARGDGTPVSDGPGDRRPW